MTDNGYSLGDILAVTQGERDNNGMFGGNGFGLLFLFAILILAGGGFGGGLFGGNGAQAAVSNAATRSDISDGFYFNNINRELLDIGNGVAQSNYSLSNEISAFRMEDARCCCETKQSIAENRYAAERNTCDIVNAIHADGEATRALINANTMQDLRDRLEQSERNTLAAQFQLSQKAQTESLVNELRPCAKPSYIAASPYAVYYPTPNCNYGCGGCNGF